MTIGDCVSMGGDELGVMVVVPVDDVVLVVDVLVVDVLVDVPVVDVLLVAAVKPVAVPPVEENMDTESV